MFSRKISQACIETLEARQMLSTNIIQICGDPGYRQLRVIGSDRPDNIVVNASANDDGTTTVVVRMNGRVKSASHVKLGNISIESRGGIDTTVFNGVGAINSYVYIDGGNGNDSIIATVDNSVRGNIFGNRGHDKIVVNELPADDSSEEIEVVDGWQKYPPINLFVNGGPGNDTIIGGDGAQNLSGDQGNDWIEGGAGDDHLEGGAGNDSLLGGEGDDEIYGGLGNDILSGGADNDQLYGDDGNDMLDGEMGENHLDGGAGDDQVWIGESGSATAGLGNDTIWGGNEDDFVYVQPSEETSVSGMTTFHGGDGEDGISRPIGSVVVLDSVEHDNVYDPSDWGGGKG